MYSAVDPESVPTQTFDWGAIKWLVAPDRTPDATLTFGEVILHPGKGHDRHNHETAEEVLHVISGHGLQMVNDEEPFPVSAGDVVYVPQGMWHSTLNTGWEPLRIIAIYNPGGTEEKLLESLPDFAQLPAGQVPQWSCNG